MHLGAGGKRQGLKPLIHYVSVYNLELILLAPVPKYWDYKCELPMYGLRNISYNGIINM